MPSRAPRLLVLCSQGGIGGAQRVAMLVAGQFARRGWHTRTVFPAVPEGGDRAANEPLLQWARQQDLPAEVHDAMLNRVAPRTGLSMARLYRLVREECPDVVNLHYGWSQIPGRDLLAVRLARPGRVVVSLHLPVGWDEVGEQARTRTRRAAHLADAIVPCSDAVRDVVAAAGVPGDKLHVVPGGIRAPDVTPDRIEARRRLGLPEQAFVVSSVARMVPEKGQADLVRAFASLLRGGETDGPPPHLVLQGEGPSLPEVAALASTCAPERVHLLPEDADTALLYAASDVFALPSYAEGWPLVLMEAAFHGLPCVATDVGGVADQVEDGVTGLLVRPGDHDALAAALQRLHSDAPLRVALGGAARLRALGEFTDEVMGARYARVFEGGHETTRDLEWLGGEGVLMNRTTQTEVAR